MGYDTNYSLSILSGDRSIDYEEEISEEFGIWFNEDIKWYGHERDMNAFSTKYPDVVFQLEGDGEESGDMWKRFFKNGKSQRIEPKLVWGVFNESKLK